MRRRRSLSFCLSQGKMRRQAREMSHSSSSEERRPLEKVDKAHERALARLEKTDDLHEEKHMSQLLAARKQQGKRRERGRRTGSSARQARTWRASSRGAEDEVCGSYCERREISSELAHPGGQRAGGREKGHERGRRTSSRSRAAAPGPGAARGTARQSSPPRAGPSTRRSSPRRPWARAACGPRGGARTGPRRSPARRRRSAPP